MKNLLVLLPLLLSVNLFSDIYTVKIGSEFSGSIQEVGLTYEDGNEERVYDTCAEGRSFFKV